ncbi:MAG TPA: GH1 family beta-glucosidase [Chitinophagaceae bacterium]|nr:GH1 family beta-glucosidase [Chitinophagaceae bacterium]
MSHLLLPGNVGAAAFGDDFLWGIAISAAQNEGAHNQYGRGPSIWDTFSRRSGKIKKGAKPHTACDFYHRYKDDLLLVKALGFKVFRFSLSWSRILPDGTGRVNKEGIAFYNRVIDECLHLGLTPFVTLYHWDLPHALEMEGGWVSYRMLKWFTRYAAVCAEAFGDRVKNWIILNEPMGFVSLGYMLGKHAPGKIGLNNFLPALHNAVLAQAEGGRVLRALVPGAYIGTSFSCSEVKPYTQKEEDIQVANRMDILLNRIFIEPLLGYGYPKDNFKLLEKLEMHNKTWKYTERMQFDVDFIGIQNYFPLVVKFNPVIPIVQAAEVRAVTRRVPRTAMGWEINGESFYRVIKRFGQYRGVKDIIITESGAAFKDVIAGGAVNDESRVNYFREYLAALLQAKNEGLPIKGYFVWTLMDNFEWAEGFDARFGLVYTDFGTQLRTVKASGHWFRNFFNML